MLIMFRFKNFASYKDETILDMRAVAYKDMKVHVINSENDKTVKTLAIYGKNASGKSNIVSALYYFESFVYNQFFDAGNREDEIDVGNKMPNVRRSRFKLGEKEDYESEFEIIFKQKEKTYQYGYIIRDDIETNKYDIVEEWLFVNDHKVFEVKLGEISIGSKYQHELKNIRETKTGRLYIGLLDYFAVGEVKTLVEGFKEYLQLKLNVHFELILESTVKGMAYGYRLSDKMVNNEEYRRNIEKFIQVADIGIVGLEVEENKNYKSEKGPRYEIKTIHNVYDDSYNVIRQEKFDLDMESSGTIRYLLFIQYILNIIEIGGVFVVDELSARLHPILTKFIVDLFQSSSNQNAQLIFTTHDISLMNRKQFRRDELAFADKNKKGESTLYTLADIKVRSDASFDKDYLAGKYGAIPVLLDDSYKEVLGDLMCQD